MRGGASRRRYTSGRWDHVTRSCAAPIQPRASCRRRSGCRSPRRARKRRAGLAPDDIVLPAGPDADAVAEILGGAGFPIEREPDEARVLWSELAVLRADGAAVRRPRGLPARLGEAPEFQRPREAPTLVDAVVAARDAGSSSTLR